MLSLYPAIKPYAIHQLAVEKPHILYVEECGNPSGIPILFVHGGPGVGCSEDDRRFFDPNIYRIILFDQRGAGRSTPHANLTNNNTYALVKDIEIIRMFFNIDYWIVFGGSWGSTLSLVYTQTHPNKVKGLILRGIFLGRPQDINWLYGNGAERIFPDYWEPVKKLIPDTYGEETIHALHKLLTSKNETVYMAAAKAWATWEASCATLKLNKKFLDSLANSHTALSLARLEAHFLANKCFLAPNQILNNGDKLKNIPGTIIHGRYDIVCTVDNAWDLHKAWPESELCIIDESGHSSAEAGIIDALVYATQKMAINYHK